MSTIIQYANLSSGDVLPFSAQRESYIDQSTDIKELEKSIDLNFVTTTFKFYVLYPDETINYEIPSEMIKEGGSYSENYQNGQRRTLSFTLYNEDGKFLPNINNFWAGTRLRLDALLTYGDKTVIFTKGYFVVTKVSPSFQSDSKEVTITANDKFSWFEGATGRLRDTYEIREGEDIEGIIKTIMLTESGDGSVFDSKELLLDEKLKGKKTQVTITKNAGDTFADILLELATQLSAEIFYNANGNLTLIPTKDITEDKDKPINYHFDADRGDLSGLNLDYDYSSIINRVVVVGSSKTGGVYKAVAVNADSRSPLCYQRIGYRTGSIINDSNIYSTTLAKERAEYELRQKLILKTTSSCNILFNPFLSVNTLISINSSYYNLINEKFLLQSVSFNLDSSGQMSVSFSNILNLFTEISDDDENRKIKRAFWSLNVTMGSNVEYWTYKKGSSDAVTMYSSSIIEGINYKDTILVAAYHATGEEARPYNWTPIGEGLFRYGDTATTLSFIKTVKSYTLDVMVKNPGYSSAFTVSRTETNPYDSTKTAGVLISRTDDTATQYTTTVFYGDKISFSATAKATEYGDWDITNVVAPSAIASTGIAVEGNLTIRNNDTHEVELRYKEEGSSSEYPTPMVAAGETFILDGLHWHYSYNIRARATKTRPKYEFSVTSVPSEIITITDDTTKLIKFGVTTLHDSAFIYSDYTLATTAFQQKPTVWSGVIDNVLRDDWLYSSSEILFVGTIIRDYVGHLVHIKGTLLTKSIQDTGIDGIPVVALTSKVGLTVASKIQRQSYCGEAEVRTIYANDDDINSYYLQAKWNGWYGCVECADERLYFGRLYNSDDALKDTWTFDAIGLDCVVKIDAILTYTD